MNAIYCGNPKRPVMGLHYGRTGKVQLLWGGAVDFTPDGGLCFLFPSVHLSRRDVYIPSLDQTRHCPAPPPRFHPTPSFD